MKKLSSIALSLVLVILSLSVFSGCATTGSTGPQIDQQTLTDASIILRNAARNAGALVIQENPEAVDKVKLAISVLDTFLIGDSYKPGELVSALEPVVKEVKDVKIALAINTVTDLYEVFYGRYAKGQLAQVNNGNAVLFLTALRDGAAQAIAVTQPTQ